MVSEPLDPAQDTLADLDRTDNILGNGDEMTCFLIPLKLKKTLKICCGSNALSTCKTKRKYEF